MNNLERLKELTENLSAFAQRQQNDEVVYNVKNGKCFGKNLYNSPEIAVQRSFISAGALFPEHNHDVFEILIVYRGELEARVDKKTMVVSVGDSIYFEPLQVHSVMATQDTWMIGITIPADGSYPYGTK